MVNLLELAGAISVVTIFVAASVIKSIKGGYLGNLLDKYSGTEVNGKLDEIQRTTEETYQATQENGEHVDDLAEAIYLLHRNDEQINEHELREKVGVNDLANDIFNNDD